MKRAAALPSAEALVEVFHAALRAGDVKGVDASLRLLAIQDSHRAEQLLDALQSSVEVVRRLKDPA